MGKADVLKVALKGNHHKALWVRVGKLKASVLKVLCSKDVLEYRVDLVSPKATDASLGFECLVDEGNVNTHCFSSGQSSTRLRKHSLNSVLLDNSVTIWI